jgi:hypothetical protein
LILLRRLTFIARFQMVDLFIAALMVSFLNQGKDMISIISFVFPGIMSTIIDIGSLCYLAFCLLSIMSGQILQADIKNKMSSRRRSRENQPTWSVHRLLPSGEAAAASSGLSSPLLDIEYSENKESAASGSNIVSDSSWIDDLSQAFHLLISIIMFMIGCSWAMIHNILIVKVTLGQEQHELVVSQSTSSLGSLFTSAKVIRFFDNFRHALLRHQHGRDAKERIVDHGYNSHDHWFHEIINRGGTNGVISLSPVSSVQLVSILFFAFAVMLPCLIVILHLSIVMVIFRISHLKRKLTTADGNALNALQKISLRYYRLLKLLSFLSAWGMFDVFGLSLFTTLVSLNAFEHLQADAPAGLLSGFYFTLMASLAFLDLSLQTKELSKSAEQTSTRALRPSARDMICDASSGEVACVRIFLFQRYQQPSLE